LDKQSWIHVKRHRQLPHNKADFPELTGLIHNPQSAFILPRDVNPGESKKTNRKGVIGRLQEIHASGIQNPNREFQISNLESSQNARLTVGNG
jgi:hypothetical protein